MNLRAGLSSGLLIAVPIPEMYSADSAEIEVAIQEALTLAKYSESDFLVSNAFSFLF